MLMNRHTDISERPKETSYATGLLPPGVEAEWLLACCFLLFVIMFLAADESIWATLYFSNPNFPVQTVP